MSQPPNPPTNTTNDGVYDEPLTIQWVVCCPYHGWHRDMKMLRKKPHGNSVIAQITCASRYPNDPILRFRLYGNLREVRSTYPTKAPEREKEY